DGQRIHGVECIGPALLSVWTWHPARCSFVDKGPPCALILSRVKPRPERIAMRLSFMTLVGSVLEFGIVVPAAVPDPVRLDSGSISGTTGASGEVRIFRGVPYAAPPVGALRWKAPQPVAHWDGVRKADEYGARCMQGGGGGAGRGGAGGRQ